MRFLEDVVPARHAGEVAVERTRTGVQCRGINRRQTKRSAQHLAIARGIDQETGADLDGTIGPIAMQMPATILTQRMNLKPIDVSDAGLDRTADEMGVEVGAEPVGVGASIVGTGGHEKSVAIAFACRERLPALMAKETEASL